MARISGVDLPGSKRVEYGLTKIQGIGVATSRRILAKAGVDLDIRVKDLTEDQVGAISSTINSEQILVEGDLRREVSLNIKRLGDINCYRGIRHRKRLPVRGQRTKTNSRTRRVGPRMAIAAKKKETK